MILCEPLMTLEAQEDVLGREPDLTHVFSAEASGTQ